MCASVCVCVSVRVSLECPCVCAHRRLEARVCECLCMYVSTHVCVYMKVCARCLCLSSGCCWTCQRLQPPWVPLLSPPSGRGVPAGCPTLGHLIVAPPLAGAWKGGVVAGALFSPIVPFLLEKAGARERRRIRREKGPGLTGTSQLTWTASGRAVFRCCLRHQKSASPFFTSAFPLWASLPGSLSSGAWP